MLRLDRESRSVFDTHMEVTLPICYQSCGSVLIFRRNAKCQGICVFSLLLEDMLP